MKIGIIGTGNMGRTFGLLWAELGHEVLFGARDPASSARALRLAGPRSAARAGSNFEAAEFGELLFWTVREAPVTAIVGSASLAGKIVVDPNNGPMPADFGLRPAPGDRSLAEALAGSAPEARVVKAFNTMAQEVLEHAPEALRSQRVSAFLAGDDEAAKAVVARLAEEIGFVPVDVGPLAAARMLEGLADFVRYMLITRGLGPLTTLSMATLPAPSATPRLGGRTPTTLS
jgi:8-hydroxy-5-deazaflavin:NADPH oxidoreductase